MAHYFSCAVLWQVLGDLLQPGSLGYGLVVVDPGSPSFWGGFPEVSRLQLAFLASGFFLFKHVQNFGVQNLFGFKEGLIRAHPYLSSVFDLGARKIRNKNKLKIRNRQHTPNCAVVDGSVSYDYEAVQPSRIRSGDDEGCVAAECEPLQASAA
eukprot:2750427-Karenia_brevis.AAC.1